MTEPYTLIHDLAGLIDAIQPEGIVSRTFYRGPGAKSVLFGFDAGQALSEHTSSHAALMQIVRGEATVTLGGDTHELAAGAWIALPPKLPHSVHAKTALIMLLTLLTTD